MRSGFPLRLHYRLELWKVRTSVRFSSSRGLVGTASARQRSAGDDFVLIRQGGNVSRYATPDHLAAALDIPSHRHAAASSGAGRYYFARAARGDDAQRHRSTGIVDGWLSGQVGPAVSGEGNFGEASGAGAQRDVLVRLRAAAAAARGAESYDRIDVNSGANLGQRFSLPHMLLPIIASPMQMSQRPRASTRSR